MKKSIGFPRSVPRQTERVCPSFGVIDATHGDLIPFAIKTCRFDKTDAPAPTRTGNLLIRSQALFRGKQSSVAVVSREHDGGHGGNVAESRPKGDISSHDSPHDTRPSRTTGWLLDSLLACARGIRVWP